MNVTVSFSGTLPADTGIHLASVKLTKVTENQEITKTFYYHYSEELTDDELVMYCWGDNLSKASDSQVAGSLWG